MNRYTIALTALLSVVVGACATDQHGRPTVGKAESKQNTGASPPTSDPMGVTGQK